MNAISPSTWSCVGCDKLAKRDWRDNATNHQASAEDQLDLFVDSGLWRASGSDSDALLVPAIF